MEATFWTLMLVHLNTPAAAVEIRPVPETPAFQTKASCEDFAKLKSIEHSVCFTGGAALTLAGKREEASIRSNILVLGPPWGSERKDTRP